MPVYVGIDVHRKRSQVAATTVTQLEAEESVLGYLPQPLSGRGARSLGAPAANSADGLSSPRCQLALRRPAGRPESSAVRSGCRR